MDYLKHFFATSLVVILTVGGLSAQISQPAEVKRITLTQQDFERICTLESTGIDEHFYIKREGRLSQKKSTQKTADVQVNYSNRTTWPSAAITAFEYAVGIWEDHIDSDVPIRVSANWTPLGERTLGSAGPTQIVEIDEGEVFTWYSIAHGSAVSGIDFVEESQGTSSEVDYDVVVNMNSQWDSWYFGTDAQTPEGLIDFVTVVLHEIGHGIGFTGSMQVPNGEMAQWGYGIPARPIIYDKFVTDGDGVEILNRQVYSSPSPLLYEAVTGQRGGIYFAGISSITANKGETVPLYSPNDWQGGSSYSHVDLETFTDTPNALMRPQIGPAFAIHSPGPITCSIFGDMGWPLTDNCQNLLDAKSEIEFSNIEEESLNFGVTNAGSTVDNTFRISNAADAEDPLVVRVSISGGSLFTINNGGQILIIEPGESADIIVRFSPLSEGLPMGELAINHNGRNMPSPISVKLTGEALPEDEVFKLDQNYPNPFNPTTTIPYALSKTAQVKLEVFDILGKHVRTLVDGQQESGRYNQLFRANDVSSGMLIYRLIVDGKSKTGKLLLVK